MPAVQINEINEIDKIVLIHPSHTLPIPCDPNYNDTT